MMISFERVGDRGIIGWYYRMHGSITLAAVSDTK